MTEWNNSITGQKSEHLSDTLGYSHEPGEPYRLSSFLLDCGLMLADIGEGSQIQDPVYIDDSIADRKDIEIIREYLDFESPSETTYAKESPQEVYEFFFESESTKIDESREYETRLTDTNEFNSFPPFIVIEGPHHSGKGYVIERLEDKIGEDYDILPFKAFYNDSASGGLHDKFIQISDNYKYLYEPDPRIGTMTMSSGLLENLEIAKEEASKCENPLVVFDRYIDSFHFKRDLADENYSDMYRSWLEGKIPEPDQIFLLKAPFETLDRRAKSLESNNRKFDERYKTVLTEGVRFFDNMESRNDVITVKNQDGDEPWVEIKNSLS